MRKVPWPVPPWCACDFPDGEAAEARLIWLAQPWWRRLYLHVFTWVQCFHVRRELLFVVVSYRCRSVRLPIKLAIMAILSALYFAFALVRWSTEL